MKDLSELEVGKKEKQSKNKMTEGEFYVMMYKSFLSKRPLSKKNQKAADEFRNEFFKLKLKTFKRVLNKYRRKL